MRIKIYIFAIYLFMSPVLANARIGRDVEIERAFKLFNKDVEKYMGYKNGDIQHRLIINDQFNAFVEGGKNVFYNSGLILKIKNVGQFIAVSAHELAHIKNGDLNKLMIAKNKAENLNSYGIGISVLGGLLSNSTDVTMGGSMLSRQVAGRSFVGYIRGQEKAADALSLEVFKKLKYSPIGVVKVQELMLEREGIVSKKAEYVRTHPTSENRLKVAKSALEKSPYKNNKFPKKWRDTFLRIQAKLFGYTKDRREVYNKYPVSDKSDLARYARAMNYYSNQKFKQAIFEIEQLLKKNPDDIFYQENKAVFLSALGNHKKAIKIYEKVLKKNRKEDMFWIKYARILIEEGSKESLKDAEYALLKARFLNPDELSLYRIMIGLYSKTKQEGKRLLAYSELMLLKRTYSELMLLKRNKRALDLAKQAQKKTKEKFSRIYKSRRYNIYDEK
ncbi:MAG: M48 family metalloprotease [Alphaproteobacteria bacterium]